MALISLEKVYAGYGRKQVLRGASAAFQKGRLTSIVGPNGCGKSTLLKATAGILPFTGGNITIDDVGLRGMRKTETAQKLAYLAQSRNIPDMTVEQMVLHGRFAHLRYPRVYRQGDKEIALSAMTQMGVSELSGRRLSSLSGGMRQNVYIAMVLAQSTDYMLLDEPTTYLDIANRIQLMRTLKGLAASGKGVIAVLHDLTLAMEFSDEIAVMDNGAIVTAGSPEDIFSSGVIKDVFGIRLDRTETEYGFAYFYDRKETDITK